MARPARGTNSRISPEDRHAALKLFRGLSVFRAVRETMPLQYVTTFLTIAMDEGKSLNEYGKALNIPPSTMSRQLQDLGPSTRKGITGLKLIESHFAPGSLREKEVYLTPKGLSLLRSLRVMQTADPALPTENGGPPRIMDDSSPDQSIQHDEHNHNHNQED